MKQRAVRTFFHRIGLIFGVPVSMVMVIFLVSGTWESIKQYPYVKLDPVTGLVEIVLLGPAIGWVVVKLADAVGRIAASLFEAETDSYPLPWRDSRFDHFVSIMHDYPKDELSMNYLARRWSFRVSLLVAGIVTWVIGKFLESILGEWIAVVVLAALLCFGISLAILYLVLADMIFELMLRLAKKGT